MKATSFTYKYGLWCDLPTKAIAPMQNERPTSNYLMAIKYKIGEREREKKAHSS
jgi:hypothetical protein